VAEIQRIRPDVDVASAMEGFVFGPDLDPQIASNLRKAGLPYRAELGASSAR
jgi:hypothetical protein